MKTRINPLVEIVAILSLAGITFTQAAGQYWSPSPLSDDWANSVWSTTSGGGSLTTWTASNDAIFDQLGTYTATINAAQTATNLNIKAGTVTFAGTNTVSATSITIDSGASLSGSADRYLKVGTTNLTVNGTLDYTGPTLGTQQVSVVGGTGSIILNTGMGIYGAFTFAGNISGGVAGSLATNAAATIDLSGNNTYAGDTLIRSGNTLRLGSSTALSSNSFFRMAGGNSMIELTGTNFSRTLATSGAGNVRIGNTGDAATTTSFGFAAVNADRTVALNGTTTWGSTTFNPGIFKLGTAASTHKVTLTTGIDLNVGTRTINTENGGAAVEAEISGAISGTGASILNKTGTGILLLSNANSYAGGTTIAANNSGNILRISNASALGTGGLTIGSGGNSDQSRLELTGDIAVTNTIATSASRNNFAPSILNLSGNNSLSSNIASGGGGSRLSFQSDSGKLTLSGSIGVRNPFFTGSGDFLVSGNITSPASNQTLTKEGSGTLVLSGASNATATLTTITAGVLQIGNAGTSGTLGTAPVTNNATLVFNRSDSFSVANTISGSGALTKQGAGTLTLGGTNDYTGVTTISAGTISVASLGNGGVSGNLGAATSAASNIVFGGGTLQYSAASAASSNRAFTINAASSATLNVSSASGDLTLTGSVPTTTGVLYKIGLGSLNLDPGAVSQSLGALSANGGEIILKSGTYATTNKDAAVSAYNVGAGARGGILTIDGATLNVGGAGNNLKIAANGNGNLSIKSGTVTSNDIVIGHNGIGGATQSGGTVTTTNLFHQDSGVGSSYTLTGGSLTAKSIYNNPTTTSGTFTLNLNGGTLKSASGTTNLIDNTVTAGSQISVLLGAGNTVIDTTNSDATIARPMGDMPSVAGTFTKAGTNTLTLTQANTYTGATQITGGTLALTGTASITSPSIIVGAATTFDVSGLATTFALGSAQTISGPGTVVGAMNVSGTLSPGSSPGTLSTDDQTWLNGGDYNWQVLNALGVAGTGYDTMAITGTLDLSSLTTGGFNVNLWSLASTGPDVNGNALNFIASNNYSWTLASATTAITGFDAANFFINVGLNNGTAGFSNELDGGAFSVTQSGNNLLLNFTAVPEPRVALLGGLGILALLRRRR